VKALLGVEHVIAVNTGTSALHLALDALAIGPGDEVVLPSLTFAAAVQTVLAVGARPVFCDVELETLNIDVADAASRVTVATKAVVPVHYGGLACDMDALQELAAAKRLKVIEDAAHAFGSTYRGRPIGTLSDATCFSFDPIKNITCGEGGAVATNLDEVASSIEAKRILGIDNDTWTRYRGERNWFYGVVTPGYRYHMSNINAAIGLRQLPRMDAFRARKVAIVRAYDEAFCRFPGARLIRHDLEEQFPFFYIMRVTDGRRDALIAHLKEHRIGSGVHYIPNHIQPLFERFRVPLPRTEQLFEEIITLPLYFEMTDEDVDRVIGAVQEFFV